MDSMKPRFHSIHVRVYINSSYNDARVFLKCIQIIHIKCFSQISLGNAHIYYRMKSTSFLSSLKNVIMQQYVEICFEISKKAKPYIDLKLCNDYVIDEITRRIK